MIQVLLQSRHHLIYNLVQLPKSYIVLLTVNWRPILSSWWANRTGRRLLPELNDALSYCITGCYSMRISVLKHLNPIPPPSRVVSLPPRMRARQLRNSRASPPLRPTAPIFPLLCRSFFPPLSVFCYRAACYTPMHHVANDPTTATLLAPRLLQSHMLCKHSHTPRTVLPQSKRKPLPIQTFLMKQLLLVHAQS